MSSRPILFITSEYPPTGGGIGIFVENLVRVLAAHGRECWVATWGRAVEYPAEGRLFRIPFIPFPPLGDALFARALRKTLKHTKLENPIINVHTPYPQSAAGADIATFHIVVRHVLPRGEYIGIKRLQYRIGFPVLYRNERKLLESKTICAVSNSVATEIRDEYRFAGKVAVVGNGVDPSRYKPGTLSENPLVLYVGRLDLNKGVLDFVRMAKLVVAQHPSTTFHIIGRGSAEQLAHNEIRRLGLVRSVKMLGYVSPETLLEEYQSSWAYVSPTRFEGLATTILEAMSCGTPCVVSDIRSNRELLSDSEALFARMQIPEDYATLVSQILDHPDLIKRLGTTTRRQVLNRFTWDHVGSRYEEVIKTSLLEERASSYPEERTKIQKAPLS